MNLPLILAEAAPVTVNQIGGMTNAAIIIAAFVVSILQIISFFRRTPPIEHDLALIKENLRNEIDEKFDTFRDELNGRLSGLSQKIETRTAELHQQIAATQAAAERRVETLYTRMSDKFEQAAEKIGKLRGHVEAHDQ